MKHYSLTLSTFTTAILFALLAVILMASILLFLPVGKWILLKMSLANGYLHSVALLSLVALGFYRARCLQQSLADLWHFPVLFHRGTVIWLLAAIGYLWNEANVGFHTLSAALFLVYLYGLSAHFISDKHWKALLLPLLLTILVLPFEHYLDVYLGFPLRLLSAEWAGSVLQLTQLPLVTVESILMIDNKAAIVDLDCSGINSLWIGLIFYLLLTWIERYRMDWRWLLFGISFVVLLVLANVFRIVILVLLDVVLELPELAKMLHQALGLLGFAIASVLVWGGLNQWGVCVRPQVAVEQDMTNRQGVTRRSHLYAATWISSVLILLLFLYQPLPLLAKSTTVHTLELPAPYIMHPALMSAQETAFFVSNHAQAEKYTVQHTLAHKPILASMVLVWSRVWKAHHVPENCYISQGYSLADKGVWQLQQQASPVHHLRHLTLTPPALSTARTTTTAPQKTQSGVYWFQSKRRSTPDYSSRVMDNLLHSGEEWVMVSILWQSAVTPDEINAFITTVKQAIENQFDENQ